MSVTVIINDSTPEAVKFLEYTRTLPFAKVETTKKTSTKSKKALGQPEFEEETPEQYATIMELSKKINRKVALRINEERKLNLPFKNKEV